MRSESGHSYPAPGHAPPGPVETKEREEVEEKAAAPVYQEAGLPLGWKTVQIMQNGRIVKGFLNTLSGKRQPEAPTAPAEAPAPEPSGPPPLPDGWTVSASHSRPGMYVFENTDTGARVETIPNFNHAASEYVGFSSAMDYLSVRRRRWRRRGRVSTPNLCCVACLRP